LCDRRKGVHAADWFRLPPGLILSTSRFSFSTAFLASLLGLAALGHGLLAVLAMREKSTTSDELAHVTGGYTFDHWND
jgi:hypothetical protein